MEMNDNERVLFDANEVNRKLKSETALLHIQYTNAIGAQESSSLLSTGSARVA